MKKKIGILTICATIILGGMRVKATTVQAASVYPGSHYGTGFDAYDETEMELSSWSNGDMFNCTWDPRNVLL